MKNQLNISTILAFAALTLVSGAKADTLLVKSGEAPDGGGDAGNLLVGVAFTPTTDITLTQLGALAASGTAGDPGFVSSGKTTQDFTAVLYSFDQEGPTYGLGTVIENAVIPTGTAVNSDDVAFTSVAPLVLTAGTEYFIGADGGTPSDLHDSELEQKGSSSSDFYSSVGFFDTPTDVTIDASGYTIADGSAPGSYIGAPPSSVDAGTQTPFNLGPTYLDGDLRYTVPGEAIPEPSAFAYGAIGLAALALLLRRRHARTL